MRIECHCSAIDISECVCSKVFTKKYITRVDIKRALAALKIRAEFKKHQAELKNNLKIYKVLKIGDWVCNEHGYIIGLFDGAQIQHSGYFTSGNDYPIEFDKIPQENFKDLLA